MTSLIRFKEWLLHPPTDGSAANLVVRLMAGGVFLMEGIMKFIFPSLGVVRFTKLGFPEPALTAHFVGTIEIVGGVLLLAGLLTRAVAMVFIVEMLVAIASTKISLFLGTSPLPLPPVPPKIGFWGVMHDIRSDYAQIMTSLFLVITGPGIWSLDALRATERSSRRLFRPTLGSQTPASVPKH
jgi:putative oxidoreductase